MPVWWEVGGGGTVPITITRHLKKETLNTATETQKLCNHVASTTDKHILRVANNKSD